MHLTPDFPHWNKLRIFYYVAYFKSFTKAGRHLRVAQSTISRTIRELEGSLGGQLFLRDSKGINLTVKGKELFFVIGKVFKEIAPLQFLWQQPNDGVDGCLKIVSISSFISMYLSYSLCYFMRAYPKLKINIEEMFKGMEVPFCKENVLLYPYIENRPDLVQSYITSLQYKLYASPEYLTRNSKLEIAEDLDNHTLIKVSDYKKNLIDINWHLKIGSILENGREPSMIIDSLIGGLKFAEEGVGIISLPSNLPGLKTSNLKEILPEMPGPTMEIYYIYSRESGEHKSVRAFGDYLKKAFTE